MIWIYGPILALLVLTFSLLIRAAAKRILAVRKKQLNYKTVQNLDYREMPQDILLAGRSYDNQFQQPVLFFMLLGFLSFHSIETFTWIIAAWCYVALRFWHAFEHISARNLKKRTYAFGLSALLLMAMWMTFLLTQLL
ncbi:MAPEG family protein [Pseudoalteromonas sp. MMG024]|uniref:MAPEG family protein n=1 Tax=Pseudoalteromonas sp. MMG024 TaxID=2909980 RepID=UPI001F2829AA|nr:MAPEG family protein [Pseudoalteromonas sp. MMG024]MCF6458342.1 MAPEG family protein [Pseudoalteromonas sp. MMG024]